jgi:nucleoside-diphosphate-sugar epimerase
MASEGHSNGAAAGAVAISGAGGFLGAHLVRGFDARGWRALPLVRVVEGHSPAGARVLEDAVNDPSLLDGIDTFVHSAAVRHRYGVDTATYHASNVDLVERAMRACAKAGVRRFVFVSSVGVYGFPTRLPITEEHPYAPRTSYSGTKVEAEMRARRVAREVPLELTIVRPTIVYGPGDRNGMLDKMAAMIRASTYRIVGSGENVLHHTHIDDIVEGVWLASTRPEARGEHFIRRAVRARRARRRPGGPARADPVGGRPGRGHGDRHGRPAGRRLHQARASDQSREARRHDAARVVRRQQGATAARIHAARGL